MRSGSRLTPIGGGALLVLLALAMPLVGVAATGSHPSPHASPRDPAARAAAYCSTIPIAQVEPEEWGFHAGQPFPGERTSYSRGHGQIDLASRTAAGVICQVDRAPGWERQIILSIGRRVLHSSHDAVMFGVPGNIMVIHTRVRSSTDPSCPVGTLGEATIFASYNGVHEDSVQFYFPPACGDHRHHYTGLDVVTNVPPN